jgi:hypothetical protein
MAESLPWSPHWEFGISHRQLATKLQYLSGKRKTCAGGGGPPSPVAGEQLDRRPPRLLFECERLPVGVADDGSLLRSGLGHHLMVHEPFQSVPLCGHVAHCGVFGTHQGRITNCMLAVLSMKCHCGPCGSSLALA